MPAAAAAVRDLRLLAAGRGRAPAVRHRSRAAACAGQRPAAGLPHRDPRPGQGAGREERRDRAGRRQGRVRRQRRGRSAAATRTEVVACYRMFISGLLDVTDNLVGRRRPCRRPTWSATTATTPTSSSPRTRAPRRSPTSRTRSRRPTASGSATRSPPAARSATTTRPWASRPAARGRASSGTSASWASTPRPRSSPSSGSATCPATCSATGCCSRGTSGSSPRSTTGTSSSTRTRTRRASFAERERLFALPRSSWDDYDRAAISPGGGVWPRTAKSMPVGAEMRAALGIARRT